MSGLLVASLATSLLLSAQPMRPTAQPMRPAAQPMRPTAQPMRPTAQPMRPTAQPMRPAAPAPPATPSLSTADLLPGWKPTASASLDTGGKKKVYVGDVIRVRVVVIARNEVPVNLPTSLDLGAFSLVGREPTRTEQLDGGKTRHELILRVAAFDVGQVTLPAIPITYVPPRKAFKGLDPSSPVSAPALVVETRPVVQAISSVLANEPHPQLKKNAPPAQILVEDRRLKTILLIVAGVLAGVALGFLLYFLLRRRRRRKKPLPPPRPAHEIALEKLVALRSAGYLERGELKPFYFGVSEAIREYLGNRYGFDSLELTTTELMDEMGEVSLTGIHGDELLRFLLDCDLVKFAKYIPPLEEAQRAVAQAEHIVHATKLIPQPEGSGDSDADGKSSASADGKSNATADGKSNASADDRAAPGARAHDGDPGHRGPREVDKAEVDGD